MKTKGYTRQGYTNVQFCNLYNGQDYLSEKASAVREFEEKKVYLKDQLISELEEKQKMIEQGCILYTVKGPKFGHPAKLLRQFICRVKILIFAWEK